MGILTVVIAIVLIMFLARKRINIGLAMLAGGCVLIVGAPIGLAQAAAAAKTALLNPVTWELAGAVVLIGILGHILKASGALDMMVDSLLRLMGDPRLLMVVLPSLIGALSVPGGAMMSAPIVDQLGNRVNIDPEHKTGINIIFRHIWYMILPIIPSMVLAANLAGLRGPELAALNIPALIAGLIFAWFYLLQGLPGRTRGRWNLRDFAMFLSCLMPLLLVVIIHLIVGVNFLLALAVGIAYAVFNLPGEPPHYKRLLSTGIKRARSMIIPGLRPSLILVVAGIMLFKELLATSGLVLEFAADLVNYGIPMWLLVLFLPLLVGLATGSHEAAVGIAIPIFVPLLPQDVYLAGIGLTYLTATLGYLMSPLHLCVILTREYFRAKFALIYRYTGPVALILLGAGLLTALSRGL